MKAIDIEILKSVLREHLPDTQQAAILKDVQRIIKEQNPEEDPYQTTTENSENGEKEKLPRIPKKQVVLITGLPENISKKDIEELAGFFLEVPEDTRSKDIPYKLKDVLSTYQCSKKASKQPAECLADLFELAPTKMFKENEIPKKPKGPIEFVFCPNNL